MNLVCTYIHKDYIDGHQCEAIRSEQFENGHIISLQLMDNTFGQVLLQKITFSRHEV